MIINYNLLMLIFMAKAQGQICVQSIKPDVRSTEKHLTN